MVRRFRFLSALVALVTLLAYAAEGATALAFCAPADVPVEEVAASPHSVAIADDGGHAHHAGGDSHTAPSDEESDASHGDHCPLGMSSSMCAPAPLPSAGAGVQVAPVTDDASVAVRIASHDAGPVHPLFHPPRA